MITINNSVFDVQGTSKKDNKAFGITLKGSEDVVIKDCVFRNQGYAGIMNHCTGKVIVEDCKFECDTMYNPIEGSQSVDNGNVVVKGCEFTGTPGNNFVNFYQFANGAVNEISDCTFTPTVDNNVIRISNRTSAPARFIVSNCTYNFNDAEATEYTGFILCQDYTSKNGVKQSFADVKVELDNVVCDGVKVTADGAAKGSIYYVYQDGAGVITGQNDPVVVVK